MRKCEKILKIILENRGKNIRKYFYKDFGKFKGILVKFHSNGFWKNFWDFKDTLEYDQDVSGSDKDIGH